MLQQLPAAQQLEGAAAAAESDVVATDARMEAERGVRRTRGGGEGGQVQASAAAVAAGDERGGSGHDGGD